MKHFGSEAFLKEKVKYSSNFVLGSSFSDYSVLA